MLSYQHSYHAANLADFHKHTMLAETLATLVADSEPLTYMETHAGRGVYDLTGEEARKTGEAKAGRALWETLAVEHPYRQTIAATQTRYGRDWYPGSPQIARSLLRASDRLHLFELHPQEYVALSMRIKAKNIRMHHRDGYKGVLALSPPVPRRGLVLIDPSYEVKSEYEQAAEFILKLRTKWPEVRILLWYPILEAGLHEAMLERLPEGNRDEVAFPEESGLRMLGSGMWRV